jgi:hypothetical protein
LAGCGAESSLEFFEDFFGERVELVVIDVLEPVFFDDLLVLFLLCLEVAARRCECVFRHRDDLCHTGLQLGPRE